MIDAAALSAKEKMDSAYAILQGTVRNRSAKERTMSDMYGELVAEKLKRLDDSTREIALHRIDKILLS